MSIQSAFNYRLDNERKDEMSTKGKAKPEVTATPKTLDDVAENLGGIIRWVSAEEPLLVVIPSKEILAVREWGKYNQKAFYLKACTLDGAPCFLKLTEGAVGKLSKKWKANAIFQFDRVTDERGKVRYKVTLKEEIGKEALAELEAAIDDADLSLDALDEAIEAIDEK